MATYVVMEPPAVDAVNAAERAVLLRDGFAFLAFLVPPLWLLWHRLWFAAALALAASIALAALGETTDLGPLGAALSLLVSLYVGLEGQTLRVGRLRRSGWREWGIVQADTMAEAEIRYLAEEAADPAVPVAVRTAPPPMSAPRAAPTGPALGLLGYPGGR